METRIDVFQSRRVLTDVIQRPPPDLSLDLLLFLEVFHPSSPLRLPLWLRRRVSKCSFTLLQVVLPILISQHSTQGISFAFLHYFFSTHSALLFFITSSTLILHLVPIFLSPISLSTTACRTS